MFDLNTIRHREAIASRSPPPSPPPPAGAPNGTEFRFYVGADNATGARIPADVLSGALGHRGMTLSDARGVWQGSGEDSTVVEILLRDAEIPAEAGGPYAWASVAAECLRAAGGQHSVMYSARRVYIGEVTYPGPG